AQGTVVRRGQTIGYVECTITDEENRLVAKATSTCLVLRDQKAAGRDSFYAGTCLFGGIACRSLAFQKWCAVPSSDGARFVQTQALSTCGAAGDGGLSSFPDKIITKPCDTERWPSG